MAPKMLIGLEAALKRILSGQALRSSALLPVRLLDRRRPRRQSLRHHRGHARDACGRTRLRRFGTIRRKVKRACPLSVHHRARRCACPRASAPSSPASLRRAARPKRSAPATPARPIANISPASLRKLDATIARAEGARAGRPHGLLRQCRRADPRSSRAGERRWTEAESRLDCRRPGAAGPLRRAALPLLHRAARPSREHHPHQRRLAGSVARDGAGRRRASVCRVQGVEGLAACRACPPARSKTARSLGLPPEAVETLAMLRLVAGDARAARPRGVRQLHPVDDPLGRRRARRLSPRQGGRRLSRRDRHGDLPASHRAAVRNHRGSYAPRLPSCASCWRSRSSGAAPIGKAACRK